MYLTKYTLKKGNQRLILQGVSHVASPELYKVIQKEMDKKIKQGYKVFLEGVSDVPSDLSHYVSKKEYTTARFLRLFFKIDDIKEKFETVGNQDEELNYPDDVIYADVSFDEIVRVLEEEKFRYIILWYSLKKVWLSLEKSLEKKKFIENLAREFEEMIETFKFKRVDAFKIILLTPLFKFHLLLLRYPFLDFRNRRAVEIIEKNAPKRALVHYGEEHISGIKKNLEKKKWELVNSSKRQLRFLDE